MAPPNARCIRGEVVLLPLLGALVARAGLRVVVRRIDALARQPTRDLRYLLVMLGPIGFGGPPRIEGS